MAKYAIIDLDKVNADPMLLQKFGDLQYYGGVLSPEETEEVFKKTYMQGCEDAFDYNEDSNGGKSSTWTETWEEFKKTL